MDTSERVELYKKLVDHFGDQTATAKALGCKQPSVNQWVSGKSSMSLSKALLAEQLTGGLFKAVDLCKELKEAGISSIQGKFTKSQDAA